MNYTQLITEVQKVALRQHNVNSFSSNDVYDEWNKPHTQYASVNIGLESADRTENTIVYNCVLYYGDRLLQNANNKIAIQDDAVKVLQGIISNLPDEITYYTPINYTIFEQEFADYIAGAYCRVRLETEFDQGNCSLDDYIEELKTLYITENGIFSVSGYDQVEVHVEGGTVEGITEEECREIIEGYDFATKDEIPSLDGYAKIVDVDASLAKKQDNISDLDVIRSGAALGATAIQEHQSLDGYATENWVNEQGFLTEHQDLSEYAKTVDVNTGLASKQPIGDYALRSELPDLAPYATKQYVQDQIIEAGGVTIEQVDTEIENKLADKNYATKDEIPSLDGYATEQWVADQGYLTEHQDLSEYALKSEIPSAANFVLKTGSTMTGDLNIGSFSDTAAKALRVRYNSQGMKIENFLISHWTDVDGTSTTDSALRFYKDYMLLNKNTYIGTSNTADNQVATHKWVEDKGYLTLHQSLKTINNLSIIGTGNITIQGSGYANIISLTQAEYDALAVKDPNTIYDITDGSPVATEEWVRSIFQYNEDTKTLNITI